MDNKGVIYKITSPTGRIYIGKTVNFEKRMRRYKRNDKTGQKIIESSIEKYGWENHKVEIIDHAPIEHLNELEIKYIKELDTFNFDNSNGMNLTRGGEGSFGAKRSDETKKLMSERKKGKIPIAASLPRSEKQLNHIKYGNIGRKRTKEAGEKKFKTELDKFINKHESILQIDLKGEIVKEWVMVPKYVAIENDIDPSYLLKALKYRTTPCKGYYWKYKK